MSIDPINNDGDLPLGNTLRTCSIVAKVGSSQIPNESSCHKAHNFFGTKSEFWYKI
jgi:hypothetical protein